MRLESIERIVEDRHLLNHPFYRRWQEGKVSLETLRSYARQYYAYESRLPHFLENALAHLEEGPARRAIEENLADEWGKPEPHPDLWVRFAEALGVRADEVRSAQPLPRTAELVDAYEDLSKRGADEALGALYAYESQFSAIAQAKAEGLRRFYGVTDARALEFFDLHSVLDEEHASAIRSGLTDGEVSRTAAARAADAWWGMLDQFEDMEVSTS
jgi:pyrroloquinoline-quinone synthase